MRLTKDNILKICPYFEKIIIQLLLKIQNKKCGDCRFDLTEYQIHHKRYGKNIVLKDLVLLCGDCHAKKSNCQSIR